MLTFDASKHEYRFAGNVVPSVTQILRPLYDFSAVAPDVLEHARQRGVAVHAAVALDIANDLDEASVDNAIAGYVQAWRSFRADMRLHQADFGEVEQRFYSKRYVFAGTPDMALHIEGQWGVLDIKTADDLHPAVALQAAAYRQLLNENTPKGNHRIESRYALRLRDNGTYRLDQLKDKNDFNVFLAMLCVHRWREANLKGA